MNVVAYIINRGPLVPLGFKIPEEEWQGKEVTLSHFKIFACVSYILLKDSNRDKIDLKARMCVFIGYGSDNMGYPFWDESSKKVITSRDVTCNENVIYKDRHAIDSKATNKHNEKENVQLEDITKDDLARHSGSSRNRNIDYALPVIPKVELRRSSKFSLPPQRCFPLANYLLLTKDGDSQFYLKPL